MKDDDTKPLHDAVIRGNAEDFARYAKSPQGERYIFQVNEKGKIPAEVIAESLQGNVLSPNMQKVFREMQLACQQFAIDHYKSLHKAVVAVPDAEINKVVRLFAASGVNPNHLNGEGYTPLHMAAMKNKVAATEALYDHGAKLNVLSANGKTALDIATERKFVGVKAVFEGFYGDKPSSPSPEMKSQGPAKQREPSPPSSTSVSPRDEGSPRKSSPRLIMGRKRS